MLLGGEGVPAQLHLLVAADAIASPRDSLESSGTDLAATLLTFAESAFPDAVQSFLDSTQYLAVCVSLSEQEFAIYSISRLLSGIGRTLATCTRLKAGPGNLGKQFGFSTVQLGSELLNRSRLYCHDSCPCGQRPSAGLSFLRCLSEQQALYSAGSRNNQAQEGPGWRTGAREVSVGRAGFNEPLGSGIGSGRDFGCAPDSKRFVEAGAPDQFHLFMFSHPH